MPEPRRLTLIAAVDAHMVLGSDGRLPWYLPADLYRFRTLTRHHALVMGRKTYLSMGRPLPDRLNVVLTSDPMRLREHRGTRGLAVATTLEDALATAAVHPSPSGRLFVIGGGHVFAQTLALADEILLTVIDTTVERPDARFPEIPGGPDGFALVGQEDHPPDARNWTAYSFRTFHRVSSLSR